MSTLKIITAFILVVLVGMLYTAYVEQELVSIYSLYLTMSLLALHIVSILWEYWESKS